MLSARAAKCGVSGLGRRKGALRSISFAMTRSRRATAATAVEKVFTRWGNAPLVGLVASLAAVTTRTYLRAGRHPTERKQSRMRDHLDAASSAPSQYIPERS